MSDIYRIFCDYIEQHNIFQERDHVIVGLSGGADSMCLLVLLKRLAGELSLRLTAVHVNHQLRGPEADADEQFVKEFCEKRKIPCVAVHAAVRSYAFSRNLSLEEAGRIARYQTFYQVARKIAGQDPIPGTIKAAVAHHRDDNAETILMNLIRGTGLKGLEGMKPCAERFGLTIVRPLLCLGRSEIEEYLNEEQVEFRTDSTNQEDEFARNKVRLNIIPQLQAINSKASEHINEAAGAIVKAQQFIESEAEKDCMLMVDSREDGYYIDLGRFSPLHAAVKEQIVRNVIGKITGSLKDITRAHVESVLGLEEKQTGRRAELPGGLIALRSYSNLILRQATRDDRLAQDMTDYARGTAAVSGTEDVHDPGEPERVLIDPTQLSPDPIRFQLWEGMTIELQLVHVNSVTRPYLIAKNEYTKAFDCAKIKGNLVLRRPEPHDEIQFLGGRKSVRKFFVDEKVPQDIRKQTLVLCDEQQVMWIIGYRMSEAFKISELTNLALQIRIIGGKDESY